VVQWENEWYRQNKYFSKFLESKGYEKAEKKTEDVNGLEHTSLRAVPLWFVLCMVFLDKIVHEPNPFKL
jgi:hypothetical protein